MSSKKSGSNKTLKFRGKQIFVVGLIALVLAAGYYRWTTGALNSDAVSVSSTAAPSPESSGDKEDTETFWGGNSDENKDENNNENSDENKDENSGSNSSSQTDGNIISQSRRDRDKLRSDTMDKWKEISSNKDAGETVKKQAEENILKLTGYSENENVIETNIKSKGFDDCFAQVSESGVTVIVKGGNLDSASVAQLKDIIIGETGVAASQIKISAEQ